MRWPLQPLQPFQQTQLQPPFGQSVASLCHPWFTTTNFSYRFPIFETSATALCGTTGIDNSSSIDIYWYLRSIDICWHLIFVAERTFPGMIAASGWPGAERFYQWQWKRQWQPPSSPAQDPRQPRGNSVERHPCNIYISGHQTLSKIIKHHHIKLYHQKQIK